RPNKSSSPCLRPAPKRLKHSTRRASAKPVRRVREKTSDSPLKLRRSHQSAAQLVDVTSLHPAAHPYRQTRSLPTVDRSQRRQRSSYELADLNQRPDHLLLFERPAHEPKTGKNLADCQKQIWLRSSDSSVRAVA